LFMVQSFALPMWYIICNATPVKNKKTRKSRSSPWSHVFMRIIYQASANSVFHQDNTDSIEENSITKGITYKRIIPISAAIPQTFLFIFRCLMYRSIKKIKNPAPITPSIRLSGSRMGCLSGVVRKKHDANDKPQQTQKLNVAEIPKARMVDALV